MGTDDSCYLSCDCGEKHLDLVIIGRFLDYFDVEANTGVLKDKAGVTLIRLQPNLTF